MQSKESLSELKKQRRKLTKLNEKVTDTCILKLLITGRFCYHALLVIRLSNGELSIIPCSW